MAVFGQVRNSRIAWPGYSIMHVLTALTQKQLNVVEAPEPTYTHPVQIMRLVATKLGRRGGR